MDYGTPIIRRCCDTAGRGWEMGKMYFTRAILRLTPIAPLSSICHKVDYFGCHSLYLYSHVSGQYQYQYLIDCIVRELILSPKWYRSLAGLRYLITDCNGRHLSINGPKNKIVMLISEQCDLVYRLAI